MRLFELVFFRIYDVGRAVDLARMTGGVMDEPSAPAGRPDRALRDTPESHSLPRPYLINMGTAGADGFGEFGAVAKIYDDGAITMCLRGRALSSLEGLSRAAETPIVRAPGGMLSLSGWSDRLFREVFDLVLPNIVDPASEPGSEAESYIAFCLLECDEGPEAYVKDNRAAIASLLMGEDTGGALHEQKIEETLAQPFSYTATDMAIFDLDRCLIVDPLARYEDILLIIEHANYRLLELRVLDRLLDKRLDEAERDLGSFIRKGRTAGSAVRKKFARIQSLRFVAMFVLENLENSSKIIGDYYLGQIYDRLCLIINTEGWSRSVQRRLDVLTSVYEMVKADNAERRTLVLEIVFIVVCIILPLLQIWQALL